MKCIIIIIQNYVIFHILLINYISNERGSYLANLAVKEEDLQPRSCGFESWHKILDKLTKPKASFNIEEKQLRQPNGEHQFFQLF